MSECYVMEQFIKTYTQRSDYCYGSLRTFSDLALVFFVISLVSLQICWTEDVLLMRNRYPSKAICDEVWLCHPCGVLIPYGWTATHYLR